MLKEEEKYLDKDQTKLKLGPDQTTVMIGKKMYIVQQATIEHTLGAPGGGTMPTHGMVSEEEEEVHHPLLALQALPQVL